MKSLTIRLALLATLAIGLQTLSPRALGQEPEDEVLRVSTNLVTVPVTVKTRQGAYVPNLRREDFRIYEDGVEQEISSFESIDKPFTVVLMLDVSDSTRTELDEIKNAATAFLNQLRAEDRAIVVAFDKGLVTLTRATGDRKVLSEAISRINTGGGTALYDAVDKVISSHLKQVPGRKAIVMLTDGIDTASLRGTYESTISLATEQYALIYPIQWNTPDRLLARQLATADNAAVGAITYTTPSGEPLRKAFDRATRYLRLIAGTSGGRFQNADKLKSLERSFALIAEELRQQYSLNYYPKNRTKSDRKRRIKVSVNVPDAEVHARASYAYDHDNR
jgi:Ca-activated chloride channel homolog